MTGKEEGVGESDKGGGSLGRGDLGKEREN